MGLLNQFNRESARALLLTVIPLACAAPFNSSTPGNITISVPEGTSNHGDPKLLCTPTGWKDVAIFFLGNFAAHVATVKLHPGESVLSASLAMIFAFFFPTSSIARGLEAIIRHARTGSTPLQKAQKAGALCEVVRAHDWEPQPGDYVREDGLKLPDWCQAPVVEIKDVSRTESRAPGTHQSTSVTALQIPSEPTNVWVKERTSPFKPSGKGISLDSRKIYGVCRLPSGYELAVVHADCIVEELTQSENRGQIEDPPQAPTSTELSSSYSVAKAAAAILQLMYGSATLLLARGDQLERYGYAAFGLTVAPYLVMSLVNLLGALLTPDYSACFMVESEIMEEAERHGGAVFQGMVGKLKYPEGAIRILFHGDGEGCKHFEIMNLNFAQGLRHRIATRKKDEIMNLNFAQGLRHRIATREKDVLQEPPQASDAIYLPACPYLSKKGLFYGGVLSSALALSVIVPLLPVAINGGFSHFKGGDSTGLQRVGTISWLAVGGIVGLCVPKVGAYTYLLVAPLGFFVVGKMLLEYGNCVRL